MRPNFHPERPDLLPTAVHQRRLVDFHQWQLQHTDSCEIEIREMLETAAQCREGHAQRDMQIAREYRDVFHSYNVVSYVTRSARNHTRAARAYRAIARILASYRDYNP